MKQLSFGQLKQLLKESTSLDNKKQYIEKVKARIDDMNDAIGMVEKDLEEIESAIYRGEITHTERGFDMPEYLVEVFTNLRSSVVDISEAKIALNRAILDVCSGIKTNHGAIVHGNKEKENNYEEIF